MKKGQLYLFLLLIVGASLLISFSEISETPKLTGKVIGDNETNVTCTESWSCADWGVCDSESQTRACTDANSCTTEDDKPDESQTCVVENVTCTESWSCADWDTCANESQTRACTDANSCTTELEKPNITQTCVVENVTCTESWSCDSWSDCDSESQTRTCTDENSCTTEEDKPDESQSCTVEDDDADDTTDDTDDDSGDIIVNTPLTPKPTPKPTPTPPAPKEPEKEELGGSDILTGQVVNLFNETNCTGCLLNDKCYDFNKTKKGDYCLENGTWAEQFSFNETCVNSFECDSNSCSEEGLCDEKSALQKLFEWFVGLFQFDFSSGNNQTNLTDNKTIEL